ncbi:peptide methionine sulfoxide reductase msrA [Histoplasma capsulatum G186AR]|uniref:peptide-methionine (S)-S-oxide reductase n=1 Tax=Ajellomyces capsulatus TaxID=5037 RepID=A0A8H8D823_AJECA|nr:peptide methionine sulfoxide reductase msrA [Histoplasma capsulatum]QSS71475.1 peptide methionine sulfoxide reductase msrA [Histoplasma capsulatum G186AR]
MALPFSSIMPPFMSRLMRHFSTTTPSLPVTPESLAARGFPENAQVATIAAGCFWGVEHLYRQNFGSGKGLLDAKVGYCGGDTTHPTYRSVCTGETGHAEALRIIFDPSLVTYRQLLEFFFRMHDPTTLNRQGGDVGTQYRSAIFTHGEEQQKIAEEIKERVAKEWWKRRVTTLVVPADQWWDAEDYHQLYLDKHPGGYECPAHFVRKFPPLSE